MRGMNERLTVLEGAAPAPRCAIAEDRDGERRVFVLGRWPGEATEEMDEPTFRRRYPDVEVSRVYALDDGIGEQMRWP